MLTIERSNEGKEKEQEREMTRLQNIVYVASWTSGAWNAVTWLYDGISDRCTMVAVLDWGAPTAFGGTFSFVCIPPLSGGDSEPCCACIPVCDT